MSERCSSIKDLSAGYGPAARPARHRLLRRPGRAAGDRRLERPRQDDVVPRRHASRRLAARLDAILRKGDRRHALARRRPLTPGIVRLGIAMTPQGDAIFPGLTVRQHLDCGAYTRSPGAIARAAATVSTTFSRLCKR